MENEIIELNANNIISIKDDFMSYIDVSDLTMKSYNDGIKHFASYMKENSIKRPTRDTFKAFRDTLKETMSINSVNAILTANRGFFNYLEKKNIYPNITKDVKSLKTSHIPTRQVLTLEQVREIYSNLTDLREKALFGLMCSTGMRVIEVSRALIEDIKIHNGEVVLFFQGKMRQDKSEYVKLPKQTLIDIQNYINDRQNGYIFVSTSNHNKGNGVTTKTLRLEIKNIFKRFGLNYDTLSCHSLRRTFATIAYNNGADIYEIKEVLRHHSISTTSRYLSQTIRDKNKTECNVGNLILGGSIE